jgi:hypothetical protein
VVREGTLPPTLGTRSGAGNEIPPAKIHKGRASGPLMVRQQLEQGGFGKSRRRWFVFVRERLPAPPGDFVAIRIAPTGDSDQPLDAHMEPFGEVPPSQHRRDRPWQFDILRGLLGDPPEGVEIPSPSDHA